MAKYKCKNCKRSKFCINNKKGNHQYCFEPRDISTNNKTSYKYIHALDRAIVDFNCGERKW